MIVFLLRVSKGSSFQSQSWPTGRWNFLCFSLPSSWKQTQSGRESAGPHSPTQMLESCRHLHLSPVEQLPWQDLLLTHCSVVCKEENLCWQESEAIWGSSLISCDKWKNYNLECWRLSACFPTMLYLQPLMPGVYPSCSVTSHACLPGPL